MIVRERVPLPRDARGELDEPAWHALRKVVLTASDMGALFNVSPRSTALSVYLDKAGLAANDPGTKFTRRGHILEPIVAHELGLRWSDAAIVKADVFLRGHDPDDAGLRIGATCDYTLMRGDDIGPLEIKTIAPSWFVRTWRGGRTRGPISPPIDNLLQLRTQILLEDADHGTIAGLVCNDSADIHAFRVDRDPKIDAMICRRVSIFWHAFDAGVLPTLRLGREAANLDRLPRETSYPPPIAHDPRLSELADRHSDLARTVREAQRELAVIEDEMRQLLDGQAVVLLPDARRVSVGKYQQGRRIRVAL